MDQLKNIPPGQTEPEKNRTDDISSKVLKWLIFECIAVLVLFLVMMLALVLRAYYPEEHSFPVQRRVVSGDVFSGSTRVQSDNRINNARRNILDGDITIMGGAPARFYSEDESSPGNMSADDDGLHPLPVADRTDLGVDAAQTQPVPGSVITTETTTEYRGDTVVETVTTIEKKGETTVQTTVTTETKNGIVIKKTTSTSTTVVETPAEQ